MCRYKETPVSSIPDKHALAAPVPSYYTFDICNTEEFPMTIINLRLSAGERDELDTAARAKGITRSDLIRQSLKSYLAPRSASKASLLADPWEDFARETVAAHKAALKDMIDRIEDTSWAASVERLYQIFRRKTVVATLGYQNPSLFTTNTEPPFGPRVTSAIGFASDDIAEISLSLEQFFLEYLWHAGDEAYAEIPKIWADAKARADAGEACPSHDEALAARTVR